MGARLRGTLRNGHGSPSGVTAGTDGAIRGLEDRLRESAFGLGRERRGADLRIGMEVELIPTRAEDGSRIPIHDASQTGSLEFLRAHAERVGWNEGLSYAGSPSFDVGGKGALAFEPGGQIELATGPMASVAALAAEFDRLLPPLVRSAQESGVFFVTRGIDPFGKLEDTELQLESERYSRMQRHLDRHGMWGRRMMRQTAAIHLNLDLGPRPLDRWQAANRIAPFLTAMFANSSTYEGEPTGHRSFRSLQWRKLDPARTGLVIGDDPPAAYTAMGLDAPALFLGPSNAPALPFRHWIERDATTESDWDRHVSTLFPEVRARGYLEIRAIDALDPGVFVVPAVIVTGALYDDEARRAITEVLPEPSLPLLVKAGECGLRDPVVAKGAADLARIALEGMQRLPGDYADERSLQITCDFLSQLTHRGLDPASLPEGRLRLE